MVTFSYGVVLTPGQWQSLFDGKQPVLGYTPVNRAGDSMQGPLVTTPSNSTSAGFSLLPGAAPSQPSDGDVWVTAFGLYAQVGGVTIGPVAGGNVAGPVTSVVGHIATFSNIGGSALADSGVSLASQPANRILATPSGGAGVPAFRVLAGADLPAPQAAALGGVFSAAAPAHLFGTGIDTNGNPTFGQPAIGDISGLATNMAAFLIGGTSAQLASTVVGVTGTGSLVFATGPVVSLGNGSTVVTQAPGDNSTKPASTAFVQGAIIAQSPLPASKYATVAALPASTYANGTAGVGATLTENANGALSVDGVAPSVADVILVKNQASAFQNGIYTVTATGSAGAPFVLTRATYYDQSAEITIGASTFVSAGTTLTATTWSQNGTANPVMGTDPISFAQTTGPGSYTAGNGLTLIGSQFSINTGITVDLSTAQTLSSKTLASPTMTGTVTVPNSVFTLGKLANGTALSVPGVAGNAGAAYADITAGTDGFILRRSGTTLGFGTIVAASVSDFSTAGNALIAAQVGVSVQAYDPQLSSTIRSNSQSTNYTLVLTDGEKQIYHPSADTTARTWTIPANASVAFPIGTAISFVNDTGAGTITIAITTDTLTLAGVGTTGARTLAAAGNATAVKITATSWQIAGPGLT